MHDAYDLVQLLKLTVQIDSIAAYDDNLLVGTKQGHLLTYSVVRKLGEHKHEVQLLCYNRNFSKKPIQQLQVIPAYQLLISLSDSVVCVHNIHKVKSQTTQTMITTLQRSKGATFFTLDIQTTTSLTGGVSVFVRLCVAVKRKLQLYYWKNGNFLELQKDIDLPEVPRAISWCQDTLCIGFKGEYRLLTLSKKESKELFPVGRAPEPTVTKISDDEFALGKDTQCIFINRKGDPTLKYALKWPEVPVALVYDNPFVIAVLSESVEIRTTEPNLFIQSVVVSRPRLVTHCSQGLVYIASQTHVWCLQAVPVSQQIKTLLQEKQFELALKLASISEECEGDKQKNIHEIQTLFAYHLFYSRQFADSMTQFLNLNTDPYDVIKLFPDLLPAQARNPQEQGSKLSEKETEASLLALIDYLSRIRCVLSMKPKTSSNSTLLSIVDTTLVKCYLQTNDAMVAPVLRLNMVHFSETERVLQKNNKVSELVILYQTKGFHTQALALLRQWTQDVDPIVQYLQHLGQEHLNLILEFSEWVINENPTEGLKIFTEDTVEVEQLPRPLVLHHLLRTHKNLAIPYLEHMIYTWKDTDPILHTTLVNLYRDRCQTLMSKPETRQEGQKMRGKLLAFLESSNHYTPQTVLNLFPKDDMFEERAILLGKQGRHEQALSIYVCILGDVPRAKKYCEHVWENQTQGYREVFVLLMRILISPPDNWLREAKIVQNQPDVSAAVDILSLHAEKINPTQALAILPDEVPLSLIKRFLQTSLQHKLNVRRRTQILKSLVYAEHLQVQEHRMNCESESILMTELTVCPVCRKRFTSQSAFARFANGDIVHYGCQKERYNAT